MLDMLIAIGLGLFILLPLARVVRAAVMTHFRQEQIFVIEQDAHYLLGHMASAIQQAGHSDPLDLAKNLHLRYVVLTMPSLAVPLMILVW